MVCLSCQPTPMVSEQWFLKLPIKMLQACKGMAGGEVVVTSVENTGFWPKDATIVGNTCLYAATGCQIFVRGKVGEQFTVRNSLVQAVVEGTVDHCCEYMTGGCVVVLGKVGRNVAAGMTGGLAYILDEDDTLMPKVWGNRTLCSHACM